MGRRAATSPPGLLTRQRKPLTLDQGIPYFVLAAAPVACGAALAVLEPPILLIAIPALIIAVTVTSRSGRGALRGEHAAAAVLVALGVVAVTWNGVRGPGEISPFDILLGAAFVALAFSSLRGGRLPVLPGWLLLAGAGLLAAALLAELFVPNPPSEYAPVPASQAFLNQTGAGDETNSDLVMLGKLELALVAVPVLIGAVAASWRRASLVGNLWLLSAVVSAGVASLDLLLGTRISELATGLPFAEGRTSGLAIHSNHLGLASAMALPLALAHAHATAPHRVRRMLGSAAIAVLVVGILASGSRASLVGAVVAVALMPLFLRGAQAKLAIGVIAALMVMLVGSVVVSAAGSQVVTLERLGGESGALESDSRRKDMLDASLSAVRAHGLTGVGFATARDAHNLYLQMLQAGGILGLTAFTVFASGAVRLGWRLSREPRAPPDSARLAAALTVSLLVWLTTGLVQNAVNDRYIVVPFGVLLGLSLAVNRQRSTLPPSAEPGHGGVRLHTRRMATEAA